MEIQRNHDLMPFLDAIRPSRFYVYLSALVILLICIFASVEVMAKDKYVVIGRSGQGNVMICNTKEQIIEIIHSAANGVDAVNATRDKLNRGHEDVQCGMAIVGFTALEGYKTIRITSGGKTYHVTPLKVLVVAFFSPQTGVVPVRPMEQYTWSLVPVITEEQFQELHDVDKHKNVKV